MSIKKFLISSGDGDVEESELDSGGHRTIGYNDVSKKIEISNAYIINDLNISGSLIGVDKIQNVNSITSSNVVVGNNLIVNGTASIALLETKNQTSLQIGDKYITILSGGNDHIDLDGAGILWGSGSIDGTTGDQQSVAYILYRGISTNDDLIEIFPGLRISGSLTSSNGITGSFSGDGSGLYGIAATAVDLAQYATLEGVSGTFVIPSEVSAAIQTYSSNNIQNIYAVLSGGNTFIGNEIISGSIISTSGFTGSFNGDGSQITGLVASQVAGIISSVSSSGNLQGDGTSGSVLTLKDNISLTSVTASFSGDGSKITNLSASQIAGLISSVATEGNITGSGLQSDKIKLKDNISLTSVTSSFSGDGSGITNVYPKVKFTAQSGAISVGDIVSISSTGIARCETTVDILSNVIGVVASSGSEGVYVQTSGEFALRSVLGSYTTGTVLYAGYAGAAATYTNIPSGGYITQVGYISGNGDAYIVIQPRVFGQKA